MIPVPSGARAWPATEVFYLGGTTPNALAFDLDHRLGARAHEMQNSTSTTEHHAGMSLI